MEEVIKNKETRRNKICLITTIFSCAIAFLFFVFSFAPFLSAAFGIFVYLILGIGVMIITIGSLGFVWIDDEFRNRWNSAFNFAKNLFNNGQVIADAIGKNVIWISIVAFLLSSIGFVINFICYKKYKDSNTKLTICIIAMSLALIALIVSNIIYLNYKDNPIG